MKIKKNLHNSASDFWYDLIDGGYLNPHEICSNEKDALKVSNAIELLIDFRDSCETQIKDFIQ